MVRKILESVITIIILFLDFNFLFRGPKIFRVSSIQLLNRFLTLIFFRDGRKSLESVKYNNYTVHGLENSLFLAESKFCNNCIFVSIIVQQRDPVSRPSSRYIFCFFCIFSGESVQLLHLLSNFCFCCTICCICCTIRCISWNTITSVAIQHDDIYLLYFWKFFWVFRLNDGKQDFKYGNTYIYFIAESLNFRAFWHTHNS